MLQVNASVITLYEYCFEFQASQNFIILREIPKLSSPSPVQNPSPKSKYKIQSPEERDWDWG